MRIGRRAISASNGSDGSASFPSHGKQGGGTQPKLVCERKFTEATEGVFEWNALTHDPLKGYAKADDDREAREGKRR
jgi:hypothetical protein